MFWRHIFVLTSAADRPREKVVRLKARYVAMSASVNYTVSAALFHVSIHRFDPFSASGQVCSHVAHSLLEVSSTSAIQEGSALRCGRLMPSVKKSSLRSLSAEFFWIVLIS